MEEDIFYTLTGYRFKDNVIITDAMEDYLEMIYRISLQKEQVHIKDLSIRLHVKASSVTKMMNRLKNQDFITFEKYGLIYLTKKGKAYSSYLLYRHNILVKFFRFLNQEDYKLEQVEKVEHFLDPVTVQNIEKFLSHYLV